MATYFLSHNKCYKYTLLYNNDKNLNALISQFDNTGSGFKRIAKNKKWINLKNDQIEILDNHVNGVKISAFVQFSLNQN